MGDSIIQLPGDEKHWPQNVKVGGKDLLITDSSGTPFATLEQGKHIVTGGFVWHKLPKSLNVNPGTGIIELNVNGKAVDQARFNYNGQLWLTQSEVEKVSEDNIDMQVFRRIRDGHPIQVETLIKLRVSGKQRKGEFNFALLGGFIATDVQSELPARLESDNKLVVQLRPGEWTIRVTGRALSDAQAFTMPEIQEPWPEQEVWVFVSDNSMRQVQVGGADSIDPNQTRLPDQWKGLPAYLLTPKKTLTLDVKERGINNITSNELSLTREMWLDFDGKGYSVKDDLTGVIHQSRISVLNSIELGQVSINGAPQFITRQSGSDESGVEIRRQRLNLSAESRFTGSHSQLPVNGWQTDLQTVNTSLHLPPGWGVLAVSGTDNLPNTWVEKWDLLDLFLVMIIVVSIRHFYGWRWSGVAVFTLLLTWQEAGAPTMIWFNLLAITALLKVLPEHRLTRFLEKYRLISLVVLATILLAYSVDTVRTSVYPQLGYGYAQQWNVESGNSRNRSKVREREVSAQADYAVEEIVVEGARSKYASQPRQVSEPRQSKRKINLQQIDPNSLVQSGPGLPTWSGNQTLYMSWSGLVRADQVSRLILLSPRVNLIINLLGIVLLICLSWRFINTRFNDNDEGGLSTWESIKMLFNRFLKSQSGHSTSVSSVFLLALLFGLITSVITPNNAYAQAMPDDDLLEELHERLVKQPDCVQRCAQIQKMAVIATAKQLQFRLLVHATIDAAVALPVSKDTWLPTTVLLDGEPASAMARDSNQVIWLSMKKGIHEVVLNGPISQRISFPMAFHLKPNFATWASPDNSWSIEGINEDGVVNTQLQFTRIVKENSSSDIQADLSSLPTFVKVNRKLRLGLDWYVETTVTRIAPNDVPLNINIPLLKNEKLLDDQLIVSDGHVALKFTANQSTVSWSSQLEASSELTLSASNSPDYLEVWSIDVSPIWRTTTSGLSINGYASESQQGGFIPVWKPWPGEILTLEVERPKGVDGQTLTIQGSQVYVNVGKRSNNVDMGLAIRSTRGVQHQIKLPKDADVHSLSIDSKKQRIQIEDGLLNVTLKPGKQYLEIKWREENTHALKYTFPTIDLQLPSVNSHTGITLPNDRWVVWVNGPVLGPAVLFWSVLSVLLVISIALGVTKITPLNTLQWFLLAIGLSQTSPALIVVVMVCFIALSIRQKMVEPLSRTAHNFMQFSLMVLVFMSVSIIVAAVANGLLGSPDMQISGNGSYSSNLKWYQDRVLAGLPQPQVITLPIWVYRVLMLLWAMWLAISLLKWTKWGWLALSTGEFWRSKESVKDKSDESTKV